MRIFSLFYTIGIFAKSPLPFISYGCKKSLNGGMTSGGRCPLFRFQNNPNDENDQRDAQHDDEKRMGEGFFQTEQKSARQALAYVGFCNQRCCADGGAVQKNGNEADTIAFLDGRFQIFVIELFHEGDVGKVRVFIQKRVNGFIGNDENVADVFSCAYG